MLINCDLDDIPGRKNNTQNFVQIPFNKFQGIMKYLCERHSIKYVEQEESYTSQASHIHKDFIPTYGKEETESISFSGKRETRLYRISESSYVNADPNVSANIEKNIFRIYMYKPVEFRSYYCKSS